MIDDHRWDDRMARRFGAAMPGVPAPGKPCGQPAGPDDVFLNQDIRSSAMQLLQDHGLEGARAHAMQRLAELAGDRDGQDAWVRILQAVEALARAAVRADGIVNRLGRAGAIRHASACARAAQRIGDLSGLAEWSLILDHIGRTGR